MNDRMEIAKTMMAAMRGSSSWAKCASETLAKQAVADADTLIVALAVTALNAPLAETETPKTYTHVVETTKLGEVKFLSPRPSPEWWGAVPGDAPAHADEVGDWREYVTSKEATKRVAVGLMNYVDSAFTWKDTPQGYEFWKCLAYGKASSAEHARARDFARLVLAQMEADGE